MDIFRNKDTYNQSLNLLESPDDFHPSDVDSAKRYIEGYETAMTKRRDDLIDYEMKTHGAAESIASTIVDSYLATIGW